MRPLLAFAALLAASVAQAETRYLGLYLNGNKIGYISSASASVSYAGKAAVRSDSRTAMSAGLLETPMTFQIDASTWSTPEGKPLRMFFRMESAGRTQTVEVTFQGANAKFVIDNSGAKTTRTLPVPTDGAIVDDPLTSLLQGNAKVGTSKAFYVLDPMTVSFVKNQVRIVGPAKTTVKGKSVDATLVTITDPRANTRVFVSAKGDLIRAEGPMGIEMLPETRDEAIRPAPKFTSAVDLAAATRLVTDKPVPDALKLSRLRLRITGRDLARLPSDTHQTVSREGDAWVVDVHPLKVTQSPGKSIAQAATGRETWLKPSLHIPSASPRFRTLAKKIVGAKKDVRSAALAIRAYVHRTMRPNAGIGVLRDASEVLETKEGVCRDYAILTATLMRAAGIPARLTSGLVSPDGTFYYHAWVEVWDGGRWIGIDSTLDRDQISASHVKLAHGNVEDAFNFTFLGNAKLEVLDARRG